MEVIRRYNENVIDLIMDKFDDELPDLYIPVVNKAWILALELWAAASELEIEMEEETAAHRKNVQATQSRKMPSPNNNQDTLKLQKLKIERRTMLDKMWLFVEKFKYKCIMFVLKKNIKTKSEEAKSSPYHTEDDDKQNMESMVKHFTEIQSRGNKKINKEGM